MESGSLEKACEILREAIEIYEKLYKEKPDNLGYQAELSVALSQLGGCLKHQVPEESGAAKEKLEKALELQESLLDQQPENEKVKEAIALTEERLKGL